MTRTAWFHTARRAFVWGAIPGALAYAVLFVWCVAFHARAEYLGVEDDGLAERVFALFEDAIIAQQLGLLALYLGIGALVGLAAWTVAELTRRVVMRPYRRWRHLAWTIGLVYAVHTWFLMLSIVEHPAIYEPQVGRSLYLDVAYLLATDVLPRALVRALGVAVPAYAVVCVAALAYRRSWLRAVPHNAWLSVGGIAAVALGVGTVSSPGATDSARPPNVILLAVDSLRADMVGQHPPVTPAIDGLARQGAHFQHAYAVMPRTYPSWASILTGEYPHQHGIRHMFPPSDPAPKLASALPRQLAAAGYRTGVISDYAGEIFSRGDFGFAYVDAPPFTVASNVRLGGLKVHVHLLPYLVEVLEGAGHPDLMAFERLGDPFWLTDRALDWVDEGDADQPFFLTVFYSSGHFPFAAPAPFYDLFTDPDYDGRSRFHKAVVGQPLAGQARAREEAQIANLYRGAIAASDAAIGTLVEELVARDLHAETVIIVTADHGELLYEDGLGVGHGDHLYGRATLHVPLVFAGAGVAPGRPVSAATPLIDIAPTVRALTGIAASTPPSTSAVADHIGRDLSGVLSGRLAAEPRPIFAETGLTFFPPETHRVDDRIQYSDGFAAFSYDPTTWAITLEPRFEETALAAKHRALIADGYKLLYVPTRDGVRFELFDVAADPTDQRDLSAAQPERLEAMKARLYAWLLADPGVVRQGDFVLPRGALGLSRRGAADGANATQTAAGPP